MGNHDVYVRGDDKADIPRHNEINERLCKGYFEEVGIVIYPPSTKYISLDI